jgi:hypothetical protein
MASAVRQPRNAKVQRPLTHDLHTGVVCVEFDGEFADPFLFSGGRPETAQKAEDDELMSSLRHLAEHARIPQPVAQPLYSGCRLFG